MSIGRPLNIVASATSSNTLFNTIIAQSTGPNVIKPDSIPSGYDWYAQGRIGSGNTPSGSYTHLIPWFQVGFADSIPFNSDIQVSIKNLRCYSHSSATNLWTKIKDDAKPHGALYTLPTFTPIIALTQFGSSDAELLTQVQNGYFVHGYSASRIAIPANLDGLIMTVEVKLVSASNSNISSSILNKYLVSVGLDYWTDLNVGTNTDALVGAFTVLTDSYTKFYATTNTLSFLQAHNPPSEIK